MTRLFLVTALALTLVGAPAQAAEHGHMDNHGNHAAQKAAQGNMKSVYEDDMKDMHKAMDVPASGDPDIDFARSMIPHHEGAVAMAATLLKDGKDPELRAMAKDIITAQEKEIAFMKDWLKKHDPAAQK